MYSLKNLGQVYPKKEFKRIIYLGLRSKTPTSLDQINQNIDSSKTIEEEVLNPSYKHSKYIDKEPLPILVIWENTLGERFYAEVV
jgi:hypothetical protein